MTQSPPKGPPSSRPPPPSNADGGRRITALAAGGSVLLLSATAVVLWPRTYGTTATFVLDAAPHIGNPVVLAGRIEAALLEREELAAVAMDLPPELRSPDPIGRLRAGIRLQSRGALGFTVEFRGSDPHSVQRIANHLADRAIQLLPKLATAPVDTAPAQALAERSRAVTEFLNAHPEITLEASSGKANPSGADSGLDALRMEKRQIEQRLGTGATDNPYADPQQDPDVLNRRLAEIKNTIVRREAALKQPHAAAPPAVARELTSQWRTLLAELASAQAAASVPATQPTINGHVTERAALPGTPLTPNRLVLSVVAALLTLAAAMIAYVLPRRPEPVKRKPYATARADQPAPPLTPSEPPARGVDPAPTPATVPGSDYPPALPRTLRSDPPLPRSDPPPAPPTGRPSSEPPGPIAVQRTVVLSGNSKSPSAAPPKRSQTTPGGLEAPLDGAAALADTAAAPPPGAHSAPAAPLFGWRPPPGAGSYSVSSSHPPPIGPHDGVKRMSVERLSPLQSQHPPAPSGSPPSAHRSPAPGAAPDAPFIVSRPPALDPEAETWAARFDTVPPPPPPAEPAPPPAEEVPRKRSGRWKTQVMGSMVPLEVSAAREEPPPASEPISVQPQVAIVPEVLRGPSAVAVAPTPVVFHNVPLGYAPKLEPETPALLALRDAVLEQASSRRITLAVTGNAGQNRAQLAASLAFALANSGARVLLVEADFDRPQLQEPLAIAAPPGAGFSQQLSARRRGQLGQPWAVLRCTSNLHALIEGRLRSPGLLASGGFDTAIQELREDQHIVVLHAPTLDKPGDLRPISPLANAVLLVNGQQPHSLQFGDGVLLGLA